MSQSGSESPTHPFLQYENVEKKEVKEKQWKRACSYIFASGSQFSQIENSKDETSIADPQTPESQNSEDDILVHISPIPAPLALYPDHIKSVLEPFGSEDIPEIGDFDNAAQKEQDNVDVTGSTMGSSTASSMVPSVGDLDRKAGGKRPSAEVIRRSVLEKTRKLGRQVEQK